MTTATVFSKQLPRQMLTEIARHLLDRLDETWTEEPTSSRECKALRIRRHKIVRAIGRMVDGQVKSVIAVLQEEFEGYDANMEDDDWLEQAESEGVLDLIEDKWSRLDSWLQILKTMNWSIHASKHQAIAGRTGRTRSAA